MYFIRFFTTKKRVVLGTAILSGIIGLVLFLVVLYQSNRLQDQLEAKRWGEKGGYAQVTAFFADGAEVTEYSLESFGHNLESDLISKSIEKESENAGARLFADAYSANGKLTVSSDKGSVSMNALGVGGDFFLFHPIEMISGSYFSGKDLNQDSVILDETAAWKLFGSNDIEGQMVTVGNIPLIVRGVAATPTGKLAEAAGMAEPILYVSYKILDGYGTNYGLNSYEVVMPNPVSGFAVSEVESLIGIDSAYMELVENSNRFSFVNRLKVLGSFGTRTMNGKAVIYPYWENMARGTEDICALLTLLYLIFWAYAACVVIVFAIWLWVGKGWRLQDYVHKWWNAFLELIQYGIPKRDKADIPKTAKGKDKSKVEKPKDKSGIPPKQKRKRKSSTGDDFTIEEL